MRGKRPRGLYLALVAVLLVVLVGSTFGVYYFTHSSTSVAPVQSTTVGQAFFVSSGLLSSNNSNQGITDEFQINLKNLPAPQSGKSYFGWLLNSKQAATALALGPLLFNHGQATKSYR